MTTKAKHWLFFSLTSICAIGVVIGTFAFIWYDMDVEEQKVGSQLLGRVVVYTSLALIIMFFISSQFILYIFKNYIDPIEKLTEETRLISISNASYRLQSVGAIETANLTAAINELAESYISLKNDARLIVEKSRSEFNIEKRRLEVLMAQLPEGVMVCNYDGRILLYNYQAQQVIERGRNVPDDKREGLLGLGRSIFGVLYRQPVVYALNYLQNQINEGVVNPVFTFITTRFGKQFLKVNVSPIPGTEDERFAISGYVLTFSDITDEIEQKSKRDIFLQTLTMNLQEELGEIQNASQSMRSMSEISSGANENLNKVERSLNNLNEHINQVAAQHMNRLSPEPTNEHILANELVYMIRADIKLQYGINTVRKVEEGVWLKVSSYNVIRGVMYLMGQLTKHMKIENLEIFVTRNHDAAFLTIQWPGSAIDIKMVEEWKQCPLMIRAKRSGVYSLQSLVIGDEKEVELEGETMVNKVKFKLPVDTHVYTPEISKIKESRPVFYESNLFDQTIQTTEMDEVLLRDLDCVVFDTETTGLAPSEGDEIISIAGVRIIKGKLHPEETFDKLVNPKRNIPLESLKIHEIYPEMLVNEPSIEKVLPEFYRFVDRAVLIAHNASFDMKFLQMKEEKTGIRLLNPVLDTLLLSVLCHPKQELHNLEDIATRLGIPVIGRHTALGDAILTAEVFIQLVPLLEAKGIKTLGQARKASKNTKFSGLHF